MKYVRKFAGSAIVIALLIAFLNVISKPPIERVQGGLMEEEAEVVKELESFAADSHSLENDRFRLEVDGSFGSVTVTDKRTGTRWGSLPDDDHVRALPGNNKRFVRSPVLVKYSEGKQFVQTYPFKEQGTLSVSRQEDSLRLDYVLTNIEISFGLELRLREDGLEATIPFDSVKEGAQFRLVSIEPFPFFEAGAETENGAIVLPDGSGALIAFREEHPRYFESYSQFVYGGDYAYATNVLERVSSIPQENVSHWRREQAALPIFGLYRDQRSFLGIITEGDSDAKINATPAGVRNIKLYRTSVEFVYRNDDLVTLAGTGAVPLMQNRMIAGDRQVRYVLLDESEPGYVGMAAAYRNYLIRDRGIEPVEAPAALPYQLRLLGGAMQGEVIGRSFVSVTTFAEAKKIIDELLEQGIDSLEVTYDGWSSDGLYGDQPKHFPAASRLGGNKELDKLAAYAKEKGVKLYLKTNYVRAAKSGDALKRSSEAIRGLNKETVESHNPRRSTRQPRGSVFYFVRPDVAYERYLSREADAFAKRGVQGVHLGAMGGMLYSDPGAENENVLSRKDGIDAWIRSMKLARERVGSTAVDYGFGYALGHVDRIDDVPLGSSGYAYSDESIPFYQIAVHGLVPYASAPLNFSDHPREHFLRAIEYGAMPSYYLTHDQPSKLERTLVDDVISSAYEDWAALSAEQYKQAAEALAQVQGQFITGHGRLGPDLYRTEYGNGVRIIVNYGDKAATADGVDVPAGGFAVVTGKEVAE
ncbi:DUF5696 domain-containing protein [Paenibacillaceae bacterium WGS1546]|uniref:DUF5696 domain-containing protein n=1 Tax=Cohnella sp. WGS1546 TaxID=3366810 RepID=UPI00372D7363